MTAASLISEHAAGADLVAYALALHDLGHGRWEDALARLDSIEALALSVTCLPDRVEAAVRARRPGAANLALAALESWYGGMDAHWERSRLAVARALLATGEQATALYQEALSLMAVARPFDRARVHLLLGEHLRRERRRADAREHLRAALEAFERLGAAPWAERTRTELQATGESACARDTAAARGLTPQERQVALLVGEGLTNKEVAAQLFLSPRTIDAHLRGIFPKLGITSRRDLRRWSMQLQPQPQPGLVAA